MPMFVAMTDAFYGANRIRKGEEFVAPEGFKRKWAVPKAEFVAPVDIPLQREQQNAARRKAESFTQLMHDMASRRKKSEAGEVPEPAPVVDAEPRDPKGPGSPKKKQANSNRAADQEL